jgi:hypothetical protein
MSRSAKPSPLAAGRVSAGLAEREKHLHFAVVYPDPSVIMPPNSPMRRIPRLNLLDCLLMQVVPPEFALPTGFLCTQ